MLRVTPCSLVEVFRQFTQMCRMLCLVVLKCWDDIKRNEECPGKEKDMASQGVMKKNKSRLKPALLVRSLMLELRHVNKRTDSISIVRNVLAQVARFGGIVQNMRMRIIG